MKFQIEELLFLTNITKGPMPFGVFLKFPVKRTGKEVGEEAVTLLQKKGVLGADRKFTREGALVTSYWEAYRCSNRHLIINKSYLAVLPDRRLIILTKCGKEYDFQTMDATVYMKLLLDKCEFMCQKENAGERRRSERIPYDVWQKERAQKEEPCLVVGVFEDQQMKREMVYYWKEEAGYVYDLNKEKVRTIQPRKMRIQFLDYLGMEGEVEAYGR